MIIWPKVIFQTKPIKIIENGKLLISASKDDDSRSYLKYPLESSCDELIKLFNKIDALTISENEISSNNHENLKTDQNALYI